MIHYISPETLERLTRMTRGLKRKGARVQVPCLCSAIVPWPPEGETSEDELTADPRDVDCPDCSVVIRTLGLLDEGLKGDSALLCSIAGTWMIG